MECSSLITFVSRSLKDIVAVSVIYIEHKDFDIIVPDGLFSVVSSCE